MFSTQFLSQTSNCVGLLLPFCSCPCPFLISPAGCYLEHPGGDVLENPTVAVSHFLNTRTRFLGTVWEIRLLNQGVGVWKSSFNPDDHLNSWQGWERDWEKGMSVDAI